MTLLLINKSCPNEQRFLVLTANTVVLEHVTLTDRPSPCIQALPVSQRRVIRHLDTHCIVGDTRVLTTGICTRKKLGREQKQPPDFY